jgi:Flp pilus assembly protein TadG
VIFAIIDLGRMLNAQITLTEAAREGARATALVDATAGAARFDDAAQATLGDLTPTITACVDENVNAVVEVTYTFDFITPLSILFGGDGTTDLTGHGVMPCVH